MTAARLSMVKTNNRSRTSDERSRARRQGCGVVGVFMGMIPYRVPGPARTRGVYVMDLLAGLENSRLMVVDSAGVSIPSEPTFTLRKGLPSGVTAVVEPAGAKSVTPAGRASNTTERGPAIPEPLACVRVSDCT